jgi:glycosyltransferase involved in cell wall biosynthesis
MEKSIFAKTVEFLESSLSRIGLLPPKKSVLFVNPDFQCSFFLKDQFRRMGWKADVYKQKHYPEKLLYSKDYIAEGKRLNNTRVGKIGNRIIFLLKLIRRYKYFLVYSSPEVYVVFRMKASTTLYSRLSPELTLLKLLNKKIVSFPSGCLEEVLYEDFVQHENGRVCRNCGYAESVCDDRKNQRSFNLRKKYFDFTIANTPLPSRRIQKEMVRYKSLDLDQYHPDIEVPDALRLPSSGNLRILHGFYNKNRLNEGKNIKGSGYVLDAIEQLKSEGYPVEYYYLTDAALVDMPYYQVQADIVVDQLIYGWWGSTAIEAMALGKPVICYLTPSWKKLFLERFTEYKSLPIVEANTKNIYDVLKRLVVDEEYRDQKGKEARLFAEKHFDVKKNAYELERIFLNL